MTLPAQRRRALRAARRSLPPSEQRRHATKAARLLGKHGSFLRARRLAAYWPSDGELDPIPLLRLAHARHKRCLLPVLRPHPKRKLWFVDYFPGEALKKNSYGIPEPRMRNRRIRLPVHLDVLLVPLVGFDARCNRLGMGGGYYDRTLAYLRSRRAWRRPRLVGVAHECQRVESLRPSPWDVPLDLVVTEKRVYERRRLVLD
jgi:5-formyltetrahydrofolate cyclo-ligase